MSAEPNKLKDFSNFNAGIIQLCGIMEYLLNTRDERPKGNKLAPEKVVMDALLRLANL